MATEAATEKTCSAVLIKFNQTKVYQTGTVSEAIDRFNTAKYFGRGTAVSARSGETEDVFIRHLGTGPGSAQLN